MSRFTLLVASVAAWLIHSIALAVAASPDTASVLCLNDGTTVTASRIETRDGKFIAFAVGSTEPHEYPMASVKGVNLPKCEAAATAASFGIHGSNTIGERLMPMLIEAFSRSIDGHAPVVTMLGPEEQLIALPPIRGRSVAVNLQAHGSATAAKGMASGAAVIGMASRRLNADEIQSLTSKFNIDPLAPGNEHVLALDGLAVIVNPRNPVRSLSLSQLAQIYSGDVARWRDLGGDDRPIKLLRRDEKSGTADTFKNLVLAPEKKSISADAEAFESSETLSDRVSSDPNAIGFVALPYVNKNAIVSIASICGVTTSPTRFSIKTEEYPLARRLYLYSLGEPSEIAARELLHFVLSDAAQPTIEEAEFIEQAISLQDEGEQQRWGEAAAKAASGKAPAHVIGGFKQTLALARRSSAVLRFESGSANLDNKAAQDISRLSRFLFGKKFYIAGFADAAGAWRNNEALARQRARQVATALREAGLHVPDEMVKSYATMAPVACNDAAGATKNRRVEIWVAR